MLCSTSKPSRWKENLSEPFRARIGLLLANIFSESLNHWGSAWLGGHLKYPAQQCAALSKSRGLNSEGRDGSRQASSYPAATRPGPRRRPTAWHGPRASLVGRRLLASRLAGLESPRHGALLVVRRHRVGVSIAPGPAGRGWIWPICFFFCLIVWVVENSESCCERLGIKTVSKCNWEYRNLYLLN